MPPSPSPSPSLSLSLPYPSAHTLKHQHKHTRGSESESSEWVGLSVATITSRRLFEQSENCSRSKKITLKFILQFFDKTDFGLVRRMMWLPSRNRLRAKNSQEAKKLKVRILNIPHHHQDSEVIYTWTHVKNAGNTCLIYFAWFNKAIFLSKNWAIKIGFFSPADIFFEKKIIIVAKKNFKQFLLCSEDKRSIHFWCLWLWSKRRRKTLNKSKRNQPVLWYFF